MYQLLNQYQNVAAFDLSRDGRILAVVYTADRERILLYQWNGPALELVGKIDLVTVLQYGLTHPEIDAIRHERKERFPKGLHGNTATITELQLSRTGDMVMITYIDRLDQDASKVAVLRIQEGKVTEWTMLEPPTSESRDFDYGDTLALSDDQGVRLVSSPYHLPSSVDYGNIGVIYSWVAGAASMVAAPDDQPIQYFGKELALSPDGSRLTTVSSPTVRAPIAAQDASGKLVTGNEWLEDPSTLLTFDLDRETGTWELVGTTVFPLEWGVLSVRMFDRDHLVISRKLLREDPDTRTPSAELFQWSGSEWVRYGELPLVVDPDNPTALLDQIEVARDSRSVFLFHGRERLPHMTTSPRIEVYQLDAWGNVLTHENIDPVKMPAVPIPGEFGRSYVRKARVSADGTVIATSVVMGTVDGGEDTLLTVLVDPNADRVIRHGSVPYVIFGDPYVFTTPYQRTAC